MAFYRIHHVRAKFRILTLVLLSSLLFMAQVGKAADKAVPRNEAFVADVQAGRIDTAHASWWGFDPADATQSLQAALKSPARKVIVENMGTPWIITGIELPSDKEIEFQSGVIVEAKRGEFLASGACLFTAKDQQNLTIRGAGATWRMHKADYHQPPYKLAEWRHTLSIRGCRNVTIEGLTLLESGGDGIYLGVGSTDSTNRDITIRRVICDGNNRQGISVITAENLLIEDCIFRNTAGTAPQAGIDFEPNRATERLVNCVLRNCRSEDNAGHAYHLYLGHLNRDSTPISIRFENCTSQGCQRYSTYVGIANREGQRSVSGSIEYIGCRFDADQGAGVYIRGSEADGCRVLFKHCEIVRRDEQETPLGPITIEAPRRLDLEAGNVEFDNCLIRDAISRQPVALIASPLTRLRNLSGSLIYESPAGRNNLTLDAAQLAAWFPMHQRLDRVPRIEFDWRQAVPLAANFSDVSLSSKFRLRRSATLLIWAEKDVPCELVAQVEGVSRHTPTPGTVTLTTANDAVQQLKPTTRGDQLVYTFAAPSTGPVRLQWQGDSKETIRLIRSSAPLVLLDESLGLNLFRSVGTLYFSVPRGTQRFALLVTGAGTGETVKATIYDASGKLVDQQDNIAAPHAFVLERKAAGANEVWSVTLEKATEGVLEDVSIQVLGIPPVIDLPIIDRRVQ